MNDCLECMIVDDSYRWEMIVWNEWLVVDYGSSLKELFDMNGW